MHFALDLLDAVTDEAPASVLPIVRQAAEAGQHLVVSRWVTEQLSRAKIGQPSDLGVDDGPFVNAMLALAARADGKKGDPAAAAFGQWAQAAFSSTPARFSELLSWCVHSARPSLDAAGHELLQLGANPMSPGRPDEEDLPVGLPGVKIGLTERRATLVARALSHQHPLAGDLVSRSSNAKSPWPVISEVGMDGTFFPVNAAGYAIALGDVKMLREVCKRANGDEHQTGIGLADAIDFALVSGLVKDCTPEMAQCVAVCIANGADLDHTQIGARLTAQRVTLAQEVSDFQYASNRPQGPDGQVGQVDGADPTDMSYGICALFMSARTGAESLAALSKLSNDYQLEINGPVTQAGSRPSLLHYAAACGHTGLIDGLLKLGADPTARDAKGLTPAAWADVFDRPGALAVLDPTAKVVLDTAAHQQNQPGHQAALVKEVPSAGPHAGSWNADHTDWHPDEDGAPEQFADPEGFSPFDDVGTGFEDAADGPGPRMKTTATAQTDQVKKTEVAPPDRNSIASSATGAQASFGAALFSRLKSSQATIAAKAAAKDDAQEVANKVEQVERTAARVAFRGQP